MKKLLDLTGTVVHMNYGQAASETPIFKLVQDGIVHEEVDITLTGQNSSKLDIQKAKRFEYDTLYWTTPSHASYTEYVVPCTLLSDGALYPAGIPKEVIKSWVSSKSHYRLLDLHTMLTHKWGTLPYFDKHVLDHLISPSHEVRRDVMTYLFDLEDYSVLTYRVTQAVITALQHKSSKYYSGSELQAKNRDEVLKDKERALGAHALDQEIWLAVLSTNVYEYHIGEAAYRGRLEPYATLFQDFHDIKAHVEDKPLKPRDYFKCSIPEEIGVETASLCSFLQTVRHRQGRNKLDDILTQIKYLGGVSQHLHRDYIEAKERERIAQEAKALENTRIHQAVLTERIYPLLQDMDQVSSLATSIEEVQSVGHQFKNCLQGSHGLWVGKGVLEGKVLLFVLQEKVVVQLRFVKGQWNVVEINSYQNSGVEARIRQTAQKIVMQLNALYDKEVCCS